VKAREAIDSSGWVTATLEAALWSVQRTTSFEHAVVLAANLGGDADTVAAVTGQIAGSLHGASAIPGRWLDQLAWRDDIAGRAGALFDAALGMGEGQARGAPSLRS
jgi:ADP-ribosyl-[dinitrogen reductase] hydrolase